MLQTARTLPTGSAVAGVAVQAFYGPDMLATPLVADPMRWQPTGELFARIGVSDTADCGMKFWPVLMSRVDCKYQFVRTRLLDISAGAGAGAHLDHGAYLFDLYVPLLVGLNLHKEPFEAGSVSLVGSMQPIGRCYVAEGHDREGCWVQTSGSIGLIVQVSEKFALLAEGARLITAVPPGPAMGDTFLQASQLSLGVQYRPR